MYGMVNKAVEDMVLRHHGEPTWSRIKERARCPFEVFLSNESYPDSVTSDLVGAASVELETAPGEILEAFGEHWVLHTAMEGYGGLMRAAGSSLPEFVRNLNDLHSRVSMIFPRLQPPDFECSDVTEGSLRLHYRSHREGLDRLVVGLVRGLGKMFSLPVSVEHVAKRAEGADHDQFLVRWPSQAA